MCKQVDTLPHEVNARLHSLVVELLKFSDETHEKFMAPHQVFVRNQMMLENTNTSHELTKVDPVFPWQNMTIESRTHTIYVLLVFPSLETRIESLSRIPRSATK